MKLYKKTENNIVYDVIEYDTSASTKELTEALELIANYKYCKIIYWLEYEPKRQERFTYYKNGKVHNDFGLAMFSFYGLNGDLVHKSSHYNDVSVFKIELRKAKLENLDERVEERNIL